MTAISKESRMKRPTMRDVAEQAGVSKTTVSHVINDTRFVEEETKQRVLQAIAELGYRPSRVARSLTTNRTETVGVIVSDSSNYFFAEILRGIEEILRPENYALLVCNTAEILEHEAHYLDLLLRQRVDGIIAAATSQRWDVLSEFEAQHMPAVFVDRHFDGLEGPFVGVDNRQGAYIGAAHLIECGHRQIGILAGFQRLSTMRERLAGFRQVLQELSIPLPEEWVITSPLSIEGGYEAMRQLLTLPRRPTAVFINNNLLTLGALLAMRDLSLLCPEGVSVVCFDDHPWAVVSEPPLTVVRQPAQQLGQVAAEMLFSLINGEQPPETRVLLECELIVRQSCCYP
jgi:LacI family transcriptional regulator